MSLEMVLKDPESVGSLDFQSSDQAWYTIHLVLQGEVLTVKYCNFSDAHDDKFNAADFKDGKSLDDFIKRFRLTSVQLQDNECSKVTSGMTVCASYVFGPDDLRFYDAVVMLVKHNDHKFGEEDLCNCAFVLFWLNGPNAGKTTETCVEHICIIQFGNVETDETLSQFLKICREIQNTATLINDNKLRSPQFESQPPTSKEAKMCKYSVSRTQISTRQSFDHWERKGMYLGENPELEERSSFYFLLIENLEVGLSSMSIVEFLKKQLSISSQAQVFPSLSSESYTRGIIIADRQEELQKLYNFINSPAHLVLSSGGRPWVITEKKFWRGAAGEKIRNSTLLAEGCLQDNSLEISDQIRIVNTTSEEYKRGKQLRDLFLEFAVHQRGLHQRLASEESKILRSWKMPWKQL